MVKAKKYIVQKQFDGLPKSTDLTIVEEELPPVTDGEFLAEAVYLSVDPYMRAMSDSVPIGETFLGTQVAEITQSKNSDYPVGKHTVAPFGWRTHTLSTGGPFPIGLPKAWIIPDPEGLPLSFYLGVLGMTGNTAYFGFLEICKPKPGETVVVSGAAGAVGSIVGQIAKIKGCKVIGIAGSEEKGKWLVNDLNFDNFINYKDPKFKEKLEELTPKGVDCYFDNVGGQISSEVLHRMNKHGRISVCGSISTYNDKEVKAGVVQSDIVSKQLKMEGFMVYQWWDRWMEGIEQNKKWIKEGKLKCSETVTKGFENTLKAFVDMLQGGNTGKAIVQI
ncbi:prostaglandin reductase 1-like isoform X2 [Zophobas morio]|uniref:prostaglandin reductase 1-like isoform X2 n=1 Tax=Zophobas morio TaxID=2755281 RepID=UPI00308300C3